MQALIAGGELALSRAVEGAEDDAEEAVRSLEARGLCAADVLVAISASGTTPYALAAAESRAPRRRRVDRGHL